MAIVKFYGGFNPTWRAGLLEREITDIISDQLDNQYPDQKCVVAVSSWREPADLVQDISNLNPDITVICSLTDPMGPIENMFSQIPGKVIPLGYVDRGIKFDFWALACSKYFKQYSIEDLYPKEFKKIYLNYNRKPHWHRVKLIRLLETCNLIDHGIVTLGNSNYTVNDSLEDFIEYGGNDVVGDVGIPNDIYSLGQLDIWNSCFLNIVSETQYEYSSNVFVSEKIYKPILGLRPFVVNGSPGIYKWLKNIGFDCFDDIFPVEQLSNQTNDYQEKFKNHQLIVDCIKKLLGQDLDKLYCSLLPRLVANQKHFYEYTRDQSLCFKFDI